MQEEKPHLRFHVGSNDMEVFQAGKWIPADSLVRENVAGMLSRMFPREHKG